MLNYEKTVNGELIKSLCSTKVGKLKARLQMITDEVIPRIDKDKIQRFDSKEESKNKLLKEKEEIEYSIIYLETVVKYLTSEETYKITISELNFLENPQEYNILDYLLRKI